MSSAPMAAPPEVLRHSWAQFGISILAGMREIWAHKFRSLLTMLGIILGVSSLVAMSALVAGMEKGAKEALVTIAVLEKVTIMPQGIPIEQRHLSDQAVGITINDVEALKQSAPLVTLLSPEMRIPAALTANGKAFRPWNCVGVWPSALELNEHIVEHGRMINELDDEMARNVCVIGTATRDELWGAPEKIGKEIIPIGETLFINGVPFTVVGMFQHYESEQDRKERLLAKSQAGQPRAGGVARNNSKRRGSFVFYLKNATVYIPLNTVWMKFRSGAELHPDRVQRDIDGGVLEVKDEAAPPFAVVPRDAAGPGLARLAFRQQALFAVLLALIMLEHADDREGHAIDEEGLADGDDVLANLFGCTPEFIAGRGANNTDVSGHLVIQFVDHAAMLDDVFIQLQRAGPHAHAIPGTEGLSVGRQCRGNAHFRRQERHQWRALLQRFHVVDGDADGLVGEVALFDGEALWRDGHLFQAADGDQGLFGAFLHAGDQGGHGHEAGDAQDNAQHREQGAELVGPNLPHAGQDGDAKLRPGMAERSEEHTSELQSLRHLVCR